MAAAARLPGRSPAEHAALAAEVKRHADAEEFPTLELDADTAREVQASWLLFCARKGSLEAAEAAVRKRLERHEPAFAQLLYPDAGRQRDDSHVDPSTGQITHGQSLQRHLSSIFAAAQPPGKAHCRGGCPMGGAGLQRAAADAAQLAAVGRKLQAEAAAEPPGGAPAGARASPSRAAAPGRRGTSRVRRTGAARGAPAPPGAAEEADLGALRQLEQSLADQMAELSRRIAAFQAVPSADEIPPGVPGSGSPAWSSRTAGSRLVSL